MGLEAKEEAIAAVREQRAIPIPPEITAPLKQRQGVGGVGCKLDDWVVGFSVGVGLFMFLKQLAIGLNDE